jgi:hypothetical protein
MIWVIPAVIIVAARNPRKKLWHSCPPLLLLAIKFATKKIAGGRSRPKARHAPALTVWRGFGVRKWCRWAREQSNKNKI